jgi:hypothetical protein
MGKLVGGIRVEGRGAGYEECSGSGTCGQSELTLADGKRFVNYACKCKEGRSGKFCQNVARRCPLFGGEPCGGATAGKCDESTGKCFCLGERSGESCGVEPTVTPCPSDCNNQGACMFYTRRSFNLTAAVPSFGFTKIGYCVCAKGFYGRECAGRLETCPTTAAGVCNGAKAGKCNPFSGKCSCSPKYEGGACDISVADKPCPADASGAACSGSAKGTCDGMFGVCRCVRPYFGAACDKKLQQCPTGERAFGAKKVFVECGGRGFCERDDSSAKCICRPGYSGTNCMTKKSCEKECGNGGKCNPFTGNCMCRYGFSGDACEKTCPKDADEVVCSGRGRCGSDGKCACLFGFSGDACSNAPCPTDKAGAVCGGAEQGKCSISTRTGRPQCDCTTGFFGYSCQFSTQALDARKTKLRAVVDAAIKAAGQAEQERNACADDEKPFLCPDDAENVEQSKRGTCVASRKDCGRAGAKQACKGKGMRWCGVSCISRQLRCPCTRSG